MTVPTRVCKCGCGTPVKGEWVRGHASRGAGGYRGGPAPLPPPGDPAWDDPDNVDVGELVPDEPGAPRHLPGDAQPADEATPAAEAGPLPPEPPPGRARPWNVVRDKPARKPPKVTAAVRSDIDAKISFALEIPARVWQARDPVCGSTFVQQRPEIAAALTEIVCQSSDLVAWFSGTGGAFMLWLNLAAACWPVATVVMAHHVYHSLEAGPAEQAEADMTRYAA
jgi:hypothetical protein